LLNKYYDPDMGGIETYPDAVAESRRGVSKSKLPPSI
jgi:hypothetical protein